jgi:membrane protein required for colicin V production
MKGINWLDILIVLPLLLGLIRGLMRGFISEIIAFVVVILGVLGSRMFAPPFSAWLAGQFAWPVDVCDIVAYMLIFIAIAIVLSLIAKLLNKFLRAIHLGWANRLLGGLFGVCKYGILMLIAVFVMEKSNQSFHWYDKSPVVQSSVLYPYCVQACTIICHWVPISENGNN